MNTNALVKASIFAIPLVVLPYALVTRTVYGRSAVASVISGGCSLGQIQDAQKIAPRHAEIQKRIRASARKLREDGGYELWSTTAGEFWYPRAYSDEDAYILAEDELDFYQTTRIQPGATVIDVGANVGTFTRRALKRGAGLVVAVEINPQLQECLRRTFAPEIQQGRVVVYSKGAWHEDAIVELRGMTVVLADDAPPMRLPVSTIDKMAAELSLTRVDFIKMDIEGAEKNALMGSRSVIAKHLPSISIATEHLDDDQKAIPALLQNISAGRYSVNLDYCLFVSDFTARPQAIHFDRQ